MVVSIADRSVTYIPMELESPLQLESCCFACKATDKPLRTCSSCKLVTYCSRECQGKDWGRHKKEDECVNIKRIRQHLDHQEAMIRANRFYLMDETVQMAGENAFLGHNVNEDDIMDLLAGRFAEQELTHDYLSRMLDLANWVSIVAERHHTRALWELMLELIVEVKRLVHATSPDFMDGSISPLLLRLHRDDDAVAFAHYCLASRAEKLVEGNTKLTWPFSDLQQDDSIINSRKGEWPFPVQQDCRFSDLVDMLRKYEFKVDTVGVSSFIMVPLAIKLRHISIYRNLSECADAFLGSATSEWLPRDIVNYIVSFLTCGDEGAAVYNEQLNQTVQLMDYIDEEYPHILRGVLDPSVLPPEERDEDQDQRFDVRLFFEKDEGSAPVLATLVEILKDRYKIA